jgi:hypothetical protein
LLGRSKNIAEAEVREDVRDRRITLAAIGIGVLIVVFTVVAQVM